MTRTRTLIILGSFMLCLAILAALEFRTENIGNSEGQMVTGSVSKEIAVVSPTPDQTRSTTQIPPQIDPGVLSGTKSGVLIPLDNGTLRGSSGTAFEMPPSENTFPSERKENIPSKQEINTPVASFEEQPEETNISPVRVITVPMQASENQSSPVVSLRPQEEPPVPIKTTPSIVSETKNEVVASNPTKSSPPVKKKTEPEKKKEVAPLVLTANAPDKLVGGQKAITRTRLALGKEISFRLTGAAPVKVKTLLLTNPDRYVVDLQGEWGIELPRVPKNLLLKGIRVGQREGATRLVFELTRTPSAAQVKKINSKTVDVVIK